MFVRGIHDCCLRYSLFDVNLIHCSSYFSSIELFFRSLEGRVRLVVDVEDMLHYCTSSKLGLASIHGIDKLPGGFGHQHGLDCLHKLARLIEKGGVQIFHPHIDGAYFLSIVREYYFLCKSAEIEETVRALICRDQYYIKKLTEHVCLSDIHPYCFAHHIEMCVQVAMYVNSQSAKILLRSDFCEAVISMFYSPYVHITSLAIETMQLIVVPGQSSSKLLVKHVCSITMGLELALSYVLILYTRNGMGSKGTCLCDRISSELDVVEECITKLYQVRSLYNREKYFLMVKLFICWSCFFLGGKQKQIQRSFVLYVARCYLSNYCVACLVVHSNYAECGSTLGFSTSLCSGITRRDDESLLSR